MLHFVLILSLGPTVIFRILSLDFERGVRLTGADHHGAANLFGVCISIGSTEDTGVGNYTPLKVGLGDAASASMVRASLECGILSYAVHAVHITEGDRPLWDGVVTMSHIEATHALRWNTTLLEELECQVGRGLF